MDLLPVASDALVVPRPAALDHLHKSTVAVGLERNVHLGLDSTRRPNKRDALVGDDGADTDRELRTDILPSPYDGLSALEAASAARDEVVRHLRWIDNRFEDLRRGL